MAVDSPWARRRPTRSGSNMHARNPDPVPDVVVTQTVYSGATQTAQAQSGPSGTKFPLGSVIGGVLGGIFIVIVIVLLWKWWGRSLEKKEHARYNQSSIKSSLKTSVANVRAMRPTGGQTPPHSSKPARPQNKGAAKSVGFAGLSDKNESNESLDEKQSHSPQFVVTPPRQSSDSGASTGGSDGDGGSESSARNPFANPVRSYAPSRPSPLSRPALVNDRTSTATEANAEQYSPPAAVGYAV